MRVFLVVLALVAGCGSAPRREPGEVPPVEREPHRGPYADLASELARSVRWDGSRAMRVAVMDFTAPDGGPCQFGEVVAEELTTELFRTGAFDVIERRNLTALLRQLHPPGEDGRVYDPETVAGELGQRLNADGVVFGTIAITAGGRARLNGRIILVGPSTIAAVGSAEVGGVRSCAGSATPAEQPRHAPASSTEPRPLGGNSTAISPGAPLVLRGQAGGPMLLSSLDPCGRGYATSAPSHALLVPAGIGTVSLRVQSAFDSTLMVELPDGRRVCDDDGGGGLQPLLRVMPGAGELRVWVGHYTGGTGVYSLMVSAESAIQ